MQPQWNISRFIDWRDVAEDLGVDVRQSRSLPAIVTCPRCKQHRQPLGRLPRSLIFQHFTHGGQWHCCSGCGRSSDLLGLLAELWRLDIPAAAARARRRGLFKSQSVGAEALTNYLQGLRQDRITAELLATSSPGQLYNPLLGNLLQRLTWQVSNNVAWREESVEKLFGALPATEITAAWGSDNPRPVNRWHSCVLNPFNGKVFTGADWQLALLVPFYELPGRPAGFQVFGRGLKTDRDSFFVAADADPKKYIREGGLHYHPQTLLEPDWVVACSELKNYLRFQTRHMLHHSTPLPLVGWRAETAVQTRHAWQQLAAQTLVLWEIRVTPLSLRTAIEQNAKLAVYPLKNTRPEIVSRWLRDFQPVDFAHYAREVSRDWPEFIDRLQRDDPRQFHVLLENIIADDELTDQLRQYCGHSVASSLKKLLRRMRPYKVVSYAGKLVERRRDGLYVLTRQKSTAELTAKKITNASVSLDRLIWYPQHGDADYVGRVHVADSVVEFTAAKDTVDADMAGWLDETLLTAGVGSLYCEPGWRRKLSEISKLFKNPKPSTGYETVGWSPEAAAIILPGWKISLTGRTTSHRLFRKTTETPGDIHPRETGQASLLCQLLVDSAIHRVFWQLYLAILDQIAAPLFNRPSPLLVLGGPVEQLLPTCLAAFGSQTPATAGGLPQHNWPTYLGRITSPVDPAAKTVIGYADWTIALASRLQASTLPQRPCRVLARTYCTEELPAGDYSQLTWLLFDYLRLLVRDVAEITMDDYRQHFAKYVCETAGAEALPPSAGWTEYADEAGYAEMLARIIEQLLADGRLQILPKNHGPDRDTVWFVNDSLYIPKSLLRQQLVRSGLPNPPIDWLSRQLLAERHVLGEEFVNGQACWCVSAKWLLEFARKSRNNELGKSGVRLAT